MSSGAHGGSLHQPGCRARLWQPVFSVPPLSWLPWCLWRLRAAVLCSSRIWVPALSHCAPLPSPRLPAMWHTQSHVNPQLGAEGPGDLPWNLPGTRSKTKPASQNTEGTGNPLKASALDSEPGVSPTSPHGHSPERGQEELALTYP